MSYSVQLCIIYNNNYISAKSYTLINTYIYTQTYVLLYMHTYKVRQKKYSVPVSRKCRNEIADFDTELLDEYVYSSIS